MGAMPVGCYKQTSTIKEGVIVRLQCILSGISMKFNLSGKGRKISKLMEKMNNLQIKLDCVISCNRDLTEAEYQSILRDFNY